MDKKIWLITGISSGLGKALAEAAINAGHFVIGTFRKKEQSEQFNTEHDGKAMSIVLDISDTKQIENAVQSLISQFGRIDVLVNNAGKGFVGAIEETSLEETREIFEVNFFGVLQLTQSVLPFMRAKKSGHIIQISSHGGIKAFAGFGIYNASKFALEGFSEALAQEVQPLGIHVSIIQPGPFRTHFASSNLGMAEMEIDDYAETAGSFRKKLKGVDGKQEGDPQKAAQAIIQLADSENPSLRMPLGKIPLTTIQMKLDSVKSDLELHRDTALNAIYS